MIFVLFESLLEVNLCIVGDGLILNIDLFVFSSLVVKFFVSGLNFNICVLDLLIMVLRILL